MEGIETMMKNMKVVSPKYTPDPNFHDAINILKPYFDKYKDVENLEVEFRLGYLEEDDDKQLFNSFVSKEFFSNIINTLRTNKHWISKEREVTKDYFDNGMRLSVECNGKKTCIKKNKLCTVDFTFNGTPFDIRVCFSTETPVDVGKFKPKKPKDIYNREKDRVSYKYKSWSYDVTSVKTIDNTIEDVIFEFELECDVKESLKTMDINYMIHSSLLKMKDIVNMCEKIEDSSKLEFYNTKEY
jgi:hypothetical protein